MDFDYVREELRLRETEDLVDILVARDEDEWRPEVFSLVEEVLRERGVSVADAVAARRQEQASDSGNAPDQGDPPDEQPVVLASFDSDVEARLCQMALGQAGIEGSLRGQESGTIELLVDAADLAEASRVLEATEQGETDSAESADFKCGSCGFMAEPLRDGERLVCQVCGEAG